MDTPGFDDTNLSDAVIATKILEWLHSSYHSGIRLNGIVYLHSIATPRMQGSALRNLRIFRKLCGDEGLKNVVLATTFWDEVDPSVASRREKELIEDNNYWGKMIMHGSQVKRLGLDRKSALHVLSTVGAHAKIALDVQQPSLPRITTPIGPHDSSGDTNHPETDVDHELETRLQERKRQQEEERQIWEKELKQLKDVLKKQTEEISKAKTVVSEQRERTRSKKEILAQVSASHKCRCKLSGPARCGVCTRKVTNVSKLFYRKLLHTPFALAYTDSADCCFCSDNAYLQCANCGCNCPVDYHPEMKAQNTFCTVM